MINLAHLFAQLCTEMHYEVAPKLIRSCVLATSGNAREFTQRRTILIVQLCIGP